MMGNGPGGLDETSGLPEEVSVAPEGAGKGDTMTLLVWSIKPQYWITSHCLTVWYRYSYASFGLISYWLSFQIPYQPCFQIPCHFFQILCWIASKFHANFGFRL